MTLRITVFTRCTNHAGMEALIGTRCYPDRIPEAPTFPLVVYHRVSTDDTPYRDHDAPTDREVTRVQLDCYASTSDGAAALAAQARAAWDGYRSGTAVGYAFQANRIATREAALNAYRQIVDVMVEHAV